jgi:hypothetical protein
MRIGVLLGFLVCGCAQQFPLPMTAAQLIQYDSGPALLAYLAQSDASPTVCDLHARGPHLAGMTADVRTALVGGLADGKVNPVLWRRCVDVLLKRLPQDGVSPLFDDVGHAYRRILADSDVERDPSLAERLATLHRLYLERPSGLDAHASVRESLVAEVRTALAKGKLGPVATHFGQELVATVDVEHGRWQGRAVDPVMMDALAESGNEMTLTRFAERLPSAELREQARRRIVRVHIALSPFPEVRAGAAAVEESLLREGHNRIALAQHPLLSAAFDGRKSLVRGVLVRQSVWARTATLLGYAEGRLDLSVLPELSLRGALWAQFQSISRPVSLCERKRDLDPSPCIAVSDVTLDNPFAYLDKGGAFHFRDNVGMGDVVALSSNSNFLLPVRIGGQPAVSLVWGLFYERPEDLVFSGLPPGGAGPSLHIRVERPTATRFVFSASSPQGPYAAVVEASAVRDFHMVSRGAMGFTGAYGSSGSSGMSGSQCSDGGRGGDGGSGGNGGPGGNGGDIVVEVACGGAPCPDTVALLQTIILSMGGPGGPGGSGGSGGPGGAGGSGRSPSTHIDSDGNSVTDDPGCSPGASGSSGANGSDGWPGPPGRAGRITFSVVP